MLTFLCFSCSKFDLLFSFMIDSGCHFENRAWSWKDEREMMLRYYEFYCNMLLETTIYLHRLACKLYSLRFETLSLDAWDDPLVKIMNSNRSTRFYFLFGHGDRVNVSIQHVILSDQYVTRSLSSREFSALRIRSSQSRREESKTYFFASQTSSLDRPILLPAHHSALRLIQTSSFLSSSKDLSDMQDLKSDNLAVQSRGFPVL